MQCDYPRLLTLLSLRGRELLSTGDDTLLAPFLAMYQYDHAGKETYLKTEEHSR
jgi:hypothetical protein